MLPFFVPLPKIHEHYRYLPKSISTSPITPLNQVTHKRVGCLLNYCVEDFIFSTKGFQLKLKQINGLDNFVFKWGRGGGLKTLKPFIRIVTDYLYFDLKKSSKFSEQIVWSTISEVYKTTIIDPCIKVIVQVQVQFQRIPWK